jgi:hypothetical protein
MANDITNVMDKLLARGLLALREQAVMALLVNRQYESTPGTQNDTINVPTPPTVSVTAVAPSSWKNAAEPQDAAPGNVAISLNQWNESVFYLTDKEQTEIAGRAGYLPMLASSAIKGLANNVDSYLLSLFRKFYGMHGTIGVIPFTNDISDATQVRKVLNNQLAPMGDRRLVINADAEAEALELRAFNDASFGVGGAAIMEGQITRRLGFEWFMDQNVGSHTAGTGAGYTVNGIHAIGVKTVTIQTGSGTILEGDIVTFAGHTQTYVATADLSGLALNIEPGLVAALADDEAMVAPGDTGGIATHVMNAAFHRDAIALVTKPLAGSAHPNALVQSAVDPISGIALRLEFIRENKRDRFSYDILYGAEVIRRELGCRLIA